MLSGFFPFAIHVNPTAIAGSCLWSLALYIGLVTVKDVIIEGLNRWFNFAERSLYTSQEEFEKTRKARESQNAFYASIFSIIPFLIVGSLCNWGVEWGLGNSWAISIGLMACIISGVYELGRRDTLDQ